MPITPIWIDNEKTVLQLNYEAPITAWEEYDAAVDRSWEMAKTVVHSVSVIHNTGTAAMPKGPAIQHLRRAVRLRPANVKTLITVIHNPFARSIVSTASRFINFGQFKLVSTLDEAYRAVHFFITTDSSSIRMAEEINPEPLIRL